MKNTKLAEIIIIVLGFVDMLENFEIKVSCLVTQWLKRWLLYLWFADFYRLDRLSLLRGKPIRSSEIVSCPSFFSDRNAWNRIFKIIIWRNYTGCHSSWKSDASLHYKHGFLSFLLRSFSIVRRLLWNCRLNVLPLCKIVIQILISLSDVFKVCSLSLDEVLHRIWSN